MTGESAFMGATGPAHDHGLMTHGSISPVVTAEYWSQDLGRLSWTAKNSRSGGVRTVLLKLRFKHISLSRSYAVLLP